MSDQRPWVAVGAWAREREKRRGVAGEILMWKCGAAKAALGGNAKEVQAVAQKAIDNCRSIGVGLGPCTLPAVGHPNFTIEAGKMEVGIGHHGEPGTHVEPLKTAAEAAPVETTEEAVSQGKRIHQSKH